jgi:hypothetical protein
VHVEAAQRTAEATQLQAVLMVAQMAAEQLTAVVLAEATVVEVQA